MRPPANCAEFNEVNKALSVVVIGETQNEQLVLIIDENGESYAAFDDYLTKLGNNIYEALDTFCESKQPIEM
ncbi:SUKH-3 domain-containing protein [Clostridium intestinale]|uniref:SUKH-3 domain-containing protein n=1 Tax=Clostridium intestinale TaxID=36845 RepID=UPI001FABBE39|nr:SUKH-3 domain-containing protein [Clostridium intestinale]